MELTEKTIQKLKDKKISIEDLNDRYFFDYGQCRTDNVLKLLNENICSFEEIVDKSKSIKDKYNGPSLYRLLRNEELFEELIQNNRLNQDDLKYLLNTVNKDYELRNVCENTSVIKYILNEFVLNKEIVDRLNTMIEKNRWHKRENIHTIFDYIEYRYDGIIEEILKLNELNKKVYGFDLNKDRKLELIELIQNNEVARDRLKYIVDNHLESNYDFDSLMQYLKKKEKKNLLNI